MKFAEIQTANTVTRVGASDAANADKFGYAVAVDGDYMVTSAPYNADLGYGTGAVYIFENIAGTWTEVLKIPGSGQYNYLSQAVALSGDTVAFDTSSSYWGTYTVDVYTRVAGTWTFQQQVTLSAVAQSIAIDGDIMIIGYQANAATAYHRSGGVWSAKSLNESGKAGGDSFGFGVSLRGYRALVGGPYDDDGGSESGSAWFFEYDPGAGTWSQVAKISNPDPYGGDHFGAGVAIDDSGLFAAGCGPPDVAAGSNSSAIYIYEYTGGTWVQRQKCIPDYALSLPVGATGSSGVSDRQCVCMVNGVVYAGYGYAFSNAGIVSVYTALNGDWSTGFVERAILLTPSTNMQYGWSLWCDGVTLAAGCPNGWYGPGYSGYVAFGVPTFIDGGGGGDTTAPTVSVVSPAEGTPLRPSDTVVFDVDDDGGPSALRHVEVRVTQGETVETVFNGTSFVGAYTASSRVETVTGYRFTVQRTGGWIAAPSFSVDAIDTAGNKAT